MALTQASTLTTAPELKPVSTTQATASRLASIDILRAINMVLMIFVNDLWSLRDIPAWLEHVPRGVDGLGLADTVFPAFLFIVGMSIPLAITARKKKGDSTTTLLGHIGARTLALLVMGLFLVNGEYIQADATGMSRTAWYSLSCLSFILIWNLYPVKVKPVMARVLQGLGVATLLTLAFIYRGGEGEVPGRFDTYWWGILGLIGWSYLASALITLFAGRNYFVIGAAWVLFCGLSMVASAKLIPPDSFLNFIPNPIMGGTLVAITLGGVITTLLVQHFRQQHKSATLLLVLAGISVGLLLLAFLTRPYWGIAKLGATPAWLFLCSALTILTFMAIYWLTDMRGKANWFTFIKPAGTDTLLCYLLPYFAYALVEFLRIHWPAWMLTGGVGLLKSFVFALGCVGVTGLLSRNGVRLKL
jgi:heparan-alpha-glucosaminide N-acetyltransferase